MLPWLPDGLRSSIKGANGLYPLAIIKRDTISGSGILLTTSDRLDSSASNRPGDEGPTWRRYRLAVGFEKGCPATEALQPPEMREIVEPSQGVPRYQHVHTAI